MLKILTLLSMALLIIGCSSGPGTIKTYPADEEGIVLNKGQAQAADNHVEQGKKLYFKGKYVQAEKHLIRSIAKDFRNWEAHYFLGLCQQKLARFDRSIGSFGNALKYCPNDKLIVAKVSFNLGYSWEKEGYLKKAAEKYKFALKMNPNLAAARAGADRIKAKGEKADKASSDKKDKAF